MKNKLGHKAKPQIVVKDGKEAVVVNAHGDNNKLSEPKTDLFEFFQKSPLAKVELEITRNKDFPKGIDL